VLLLLHERWLCRVLLAAPVGYQADPAPAAVALQCPGWMAHCHLKTASSILLLQQHCPRQCCLHQPRCGLQQAQLQALAAPSVLALLLLLLVLLVGAIP
jgi:hypothetical protein